MAIKVDRTEMQCKKCGLPCVVTTSKDKSWDGFVKYGCRHVVAALLKLLLEKDLKARIGLKKKAVRVSGNPEVGKRKRSPRRV